MNDSHWGIIGEFYYELKSMQIFTSQANFFNSLLLLDCSFPAQAGIIKYDCFTASAKDNLNKSLTLQADFINNINKQIGSISQNQANKLNAKLLNIVNTVTKYAITYRTAQKTLPILEEYDQHDMNQLSNYFLAKQSSFNLGYNIYLLIYLAVNKRLPSNFFFGTNYQAQLDEFNNEVTCKYGVTSIPGIQTIIRLANKKQPNIFALYEYADMLYYGSTNGPQKDIVKAFNLYKSISSTNDQSHCHPLAFWTLAFIYLNYHQSEYEELENCETIPELEEMSRIEQIEAAIQNAKFAYSLTGNPAAANILGKIALITEDEVAGIDHLKQKYGVDSAENYFKYAADQHYLYAYANLAYLFIEKLFNDKENESVYLEKYIHTLVEQAEQGDPWAANMLGRFYLTGIVQNRNTTQQRIFEDEKNPDIAFEYFEEAVKDKKDHSSGWAYANMIVSFPEKYKNNFDKLKNDILICIKINNREAIDHIMQNLIDKYKNYFTKAQCQALMKILKNISSKTHSYD